jgi:hypothetical protein
MGRLMEKEMIGAPPMARLFIDAADYPNSNHHNNSGPDYYGSSTWYL